MDTMPSPPDLASLPAAEKDALILTLLAQVEELIARVAVLEAENAALRTYAAKLETRLDWLLRLAPTHKQGDKLRAVIKKYRQNLFVFATNRAIPATNNGSERALRPCVIFRPFDKLRSDQLLPRRMGRRTLC
ncbi:MAG: IS66 family transposase [Ktedonobacteraceae bacterium]